MPMISVPAIYDGEEIRLLETAPVQEPYHVLVTFVEPTAPAGSDAPEHSFWSTFGVWEDDRPIEDTLRDIYEGRHSSSTPPAL
jgi:hypothetical protein